MTGIYKAESLHPMVGMPRPRQSLLKTNRYVNKGFIQTSRGCHHGCLFCAEPTMYGLRFRYRPVDELVAEVEELDERVILLNDADFFGTPKRATEVMKAFKGRGLKWQAAVNSREANDDRLLELAAESGCFMLSIGFESISRETLRNVHKCQATPTIIERWSRSCTSTASWCSVSSSSASRATSPRSSTRPFGSPSMPSSTCAATPILTPYPGTINWFEMMRRRQIVSFDWDKYDQSHIVFQPKGLSTDQLYRGYLETYDAFYTLRSMLHRFPYDGSRSRAYWAIYNAFFRKGGIVTRDRNEFIGCANGEARLARRSTAHPSEG